MPKNTTQWPQVGLKPGTLFNPEASALTLRPRTNVYLFHGIINNAKILSLCIFIDIYLCVCLSVHYLILRNSEFKI